MKKIGLLVLPLAGGLWCRHRVSVHLDNTAVAARTASKFTYDSKTHVLSIRLASGLKIVLNLDNADYFLQSTWVDLCRTYLLLATR